MKIYKNIWEIYEISEYQKPGCNRAKVSIGAASRFLGSLGIHVRRSPRHMQIWRSMECPENLEASLESSKGSYRGSRSYHKLLTNLCPGRIHENQ